VTHVEVRRGRTREVTKRHVTSLIPLLRGGGTIVHDLPQAVPESTVQKRPVRQAAVVSRDRTRLMLD